MIQEMRIGTGAKMELLQRAAPDRGAGKRAGMLVPLQQFATERYVWPHELLRLWPAVRAAKTGAFSLCNRFLVAKNNPAAATGAAAWQDEKSPDFTA